MHRFFIILAIGLTMALATAFSASADNDDRKSQLQQMGILKADQCDTDCDGTLSIDELEAVGLESTLPAGIQINELDTDGDGMISQAELDAYYKSEEIRKDEKRKNLQDKARKSNSPKIHF